MPVKQIKLPSDSVRADLCLGLTVTGQYTLITMGLIIALDRLAPFTPGLRKTLGMR